MDRLWQMNGWLAREARFLDTNLELFKQFCMKLLELGVLLDRSWLHIRALHPQYAGVARLWTRETGIEERYLDHGFEETRTYLTSPVRFIVEGSRVDGASTPRRLCPSRFSMSSARRAMRIMRSRRSSIRTGRRMRSPGPRGRRVVSTTTISSSSMTCCRTSRRSPRSRACGGSPPTCCGLMSGVSRESSS